MKNCPICKENKLQYFESKMIAFHYTDPYVECICGFRYIESLKEHKDRDLEIGKSDFEIDKMRKQKAEYVLVTKYNQAIDSDTEYSGSPDNNSRKDVDIFHAPML